MRFNGVDPTTLHRAISIAKEIPPGMAGRSIATMRGNRAEDLGGVQEEREEYIVRVNIAGRDTQEAWQVRAILAQWACSSGRETARIEPTHWPQAYYEGICQEITPPTFRPRFATVDVIFLLPDGRAASAAPRSAQGSGASLNVRIGGSSRADMVITQTLTSAKNGVVLSMDGESILCLTGTISAGQTICADFAQGSFTIDGEHAEARLDYILSRPGVEFTPGLHEITTNAAGTILAQWRERWM